jgi:hypothetical protein
MTDLCVADGIVNANGGSETHRVLLEDEMRRMIFNNEMTQRNSE